MPIYEYQCSCGLRFEKSVKADKRENAQKCRCGENASWVMPKGVSFSFKPNVDGPGPQNTGVSSWDQNVDRIIGADAKKKWGVIDERDRHKQEMLRNNPGKTKADLAKNPDGTYHVMQGDERKSADAATNARLRHYQVAHLIKAKTGVDV